ncbi:MAG: anaerobic ribonucleoside triphosphate reductase, partial [Synergistaceae bacterium]|nr:anaerobic ribonucleoside triphosphate reductase [Synergistaceae bacterium]
MIRTIRKRDGRQVGYDRGKIEAAIVKAFAATGEEDYADREKPAAGKVALAAEERLEETRLISPSVEQIQDVVENALMDSGYIKTARAYILYRSERSKIREMNTSLMKTYEEIAFKSSVDCDHKRENANIDADTPMGTMLKYGSEGAKKFYEMFVIDPVFSSAHRSGDIHIHDLDFYAITTTCCQIDLIKLFDGGFSTGHGVLREPNGIASYSALACIAIQSNQNDQHGGQSIVNFDYAMARGVAKTYAKKYRELLLTSLTLLSGEQCETRAREALTRLRDGGNIPSIGNERHMPSELEILSSAGFDAKIASDAQKFAAAHAREATERETYQAMEGFIHNLNTMHSRAGAQTPFSSINYGMDTSHEGRMAMKCVLLATEAGLGGGETPIFPIQIFRVKEGVNFNPG